LSGLGAHLVRAVPPLLGVIGRSPASLAGRVVSLLQDARLDLKPELLAHYGARASVEELGSDEAAYRLLGAQRNTMILGIFALPARYLAADLRHPALAGLSAWHDRELPGDIASLTALF
jgi:aminoglycoside/choline kinase family phosphotransferase